MSMTDYIGALTIIIIVVSLNPYGVSPMCLGDRLTVTCRAEGLSNTNFIRWNITTNVQGRSESGLRFLSAAGQSIIAPISLNRITFNFTLESDADDPDVSSVTVTSNLSVTITPRLNETVIECSAIAQNNSVVDPETTNIHVITSESTDMGISLYDYSAQ